MSLRALRPAIACAALIVASAGARAQDQGLCGLSFNAPEEAQGKIVSSGQYDLAQSNERYLAYFRRAGGAILTLTTASHPAHPAVVCRSIVEQNGAFHIKTEARCGGPKPACDAMMAEFAALNEEMRRQIEQDRRQRR